MGIRRSTTLGNFGKTPWKKVLRNFFVGWYAPFRAKVISISPLWLRRFFAPIYDYLDMTLVDHGIFRLFYLNRHKISDNVWRAAQPWPHQIGNVARWHGIKTIVNLRGERDCGAFRLEQKACEKHGITLVNDLKLFSRAAPSKDTILGFKAHFDALEYPLLMHCKSGADRMGLASVLYLHLVEGVPIEEARHQLSPWYGHIKQAKTGILDEFFNQYLAYRQENDIEFIDWVETVYDEKELAQSFNSQSWANTIVDTFLRRE